MASEFDNVEGSAEGSTRREGPAKRILTTAGRRTRNFPPLVVALLLVAFIVVSILPSSLNLPQSQPSTVLEYAPIPPETDTPPPPQSGGPSSLGLASSNTLLSRPPAAAPDAAKEIPPVNAQKKCVRGRQTEDPNSPPCQAFFQGDNGGATWQGVTKDEVTALLYTSVGNILDLGQGTSDPTPSNGTYCDVDIFDCDGDGKADDDGDHIWVRIANALSRYFNARYQTYNRHIHLYYYFSSANTAAGRRGDAQDNWETLKPFAVVPDTWNGGFEDDYIDAMAARQISVFGAFQGKPRSYYQKPTNARKVWSYWPDIENQVDQYVNYTCTKAHPGTVVNKGDFAGQQRKYGFYWTTDPGYEPLRHFKNLAIPALKAKCGITGPEYTYRANNYWFNNSNRGADRQEAQTNAAKMQSDGVNTVLWLGGAETHLSESMARIAYFPEFVIAGDGNNDGRGYASRQEQSVWNNVWVNSYQLRGDDLSRDYGYQAYKEAEPDGTQYYWAVNFYRDWFTLFMAIQTAGPKLAPDTVDAGLHAIQSKESNSPYLASFFFHPGDYSGVKDGHEAFWDRNGKSPNGDTGCYRMVRGGQRYLANGWGASMGAGLDVRGYNAPDPCNAYNGTGVAFVVA